MIRSFLVSRRKRTVPNVTIATAAAVAALVIAAPGAIAGQGSVSPPPANPTSADQIQNIDQVKTAIRGYYGDTLTSDVDPVPNSIDGGDKILHTFSQTGAYAKEMAGIEDDAVKYLDKQAKQGKFSAQPAIVLDVDDTSLNTYNYEIYSNFVFDPTTNNAFADAAAFPAVPGMPGLASRAVTDGYAVFFLTGRRTPRHDGTVTNLENAGYDVQEDQLYLRPLNDAASWLTSCAPSCSTTQYKSLTRQHIESLGYDIVANFGDQFSDLNGGFSDETFKLPNPMYFLA